MRSLLLALFIVAASAASANNITVSNTGLTGQNTTSDFTLVTFDLAWENSWRTSTNESNYDGAWIFVKFRKNGTNDWRHCTISGTGNTPGAGSAFSVPTDGKGAFIYRSANGLGGVSFTGNLLQWNYGVDGVADNDSVEVRVFALEMAYVTPGSFYLGSGGTEPNAFENGSSGTPYQVTSNSAITIGTATGNLNVVSGTGSIPAAYPKGFAAFWIMKYETSQQQYVDFLNHIDLLRANANGAPGIFTGTHPALIAPQPERAMGTLGFQYSAALADWSGLRPMTELEFEKASRGQNINSVPNEYVWGSTAVTELTSTITTGMADESVATPVTANANLANGYAGRLARVGLFARPSGSTRSLSGGTYYGVMNMGDNVIENVITATSTQGRAVDAAVHGDGYLAADGKSNITAWTSYLAWGMRGGGASDPSTAARTSDRSRATFYSSYSNDFPGGIHGVRMVRTAP